MKGETCLSNLREEGKGNSEGVFELIRLPRCYSSIRLGGLIFFWWGNSSRRMGAGFIFVCFPSEQWWPPPFLEQWGYNIIALVLLNYQDSTSVLKSSPLPGLATDTHTHTGVVNLNPEEPSQSRWTQYSSAPCSPALHVPPSARTVPLGSHAPLWCI